MGWAALIKALKPLLLVIILHCLASSEVSKLKSEILREVDNNSRVACYSFSFKINSGSFTPCALAALIVLLLFMAKYHNKTWFYKWFFIFFWFVCFQIWCKLSITNFVLGFGWDVIFGIVGVIIYRGWRGNKLRITNKQINQERVIGSAYL